MVIILTCILIWLPMCWYCFRNQASGIIGDSQKMQEIYDNWGVNYDALGPNVCVDDDGGRDD